jgi:hypothetical protein
VAVLLILLVLSACLLAAGAAGVAVGCLALFPFVTVAGVACSPGRFAPTAGDAHVRLASSP